MWVELTDGRTIGVPLAWFPRLLHATPEQRSQCRIGMTGAGLHWKNWTRISRSKVYWPAGETSQPSGRSRRETSDVAGTRPLDITPLANAIDRLREGLARHQSERRMISYATD